MNYNSKQIEYASFLRRVGASLIDTIVLVLITIVVSFVFGIFSYFLFGPGASDVVGFFLGLVVGWMFYALFESSELMATPGKLALGIQVQDEDFQRLTFGRATGRHFAKIFSNATLGIGYLFPLWTERRQTLHDIVAKTVVIKK
ncbi:RDD family protein [Rhizobium sp. MHM7A]|uniref:RDD family protein n=1 Tax=Rhizobium sp. MHM7A TaxID=2583233 RepID=UPI001106EAB3|nr:RDD family protein [Rhizobium sp. MHM7A]TLX16009.1 RDD family protein [Rhizobium sp. MHM7A]